MAEEEGTRRWQRIEKSSVDPILAIRTAIVAVKRAPRDPEARRRLHTIGAEHWEQLAVLLADEARAADDPTVAAAFFEELADVQESLDQPIETIAAMEKVVELEPDRAEHHDRLAWLYRRADAWIKAAEAYERVAELSPDERGRAALRAAGKLYRDHGKLDRAAKIYKAIVERRASDADAWRALDEILTELGRWHEAAKVRGERAARAKGVEKAALLRSQARALEQIGEATAAASLVTQAQDHAPDSVSGLVDHADVLARGGKPKEAAAILSTRIDDAVDRHASTDDVASLRLRLFDILDEQLRDRNGASMVMADLLAAAPEYLPALERLAARAARDGDPRAHAAALLRYAAAVPDPLSRGYAVLEAARRYRDVGDHKAAVSSFEDAAELVDDEAVRRELDDARTAQIVAKAADEAQSGDRQSAERRLRGILASQRHNPEANLALVDLLEAAGKLDAAAEQLREALGAAPENMPGERLAVLVLRFARVMGRLGDDDESHQLLHEAHRLDRKALPIQLALGESCFARKIWRQAALHLGTLADHPDASQHAKDVAAALVHAAQAETRALRPQNALKHFEAAAKLDPSCAPAWHALGEAAMERGDVAQAVDHLEREAQATIAPGDRVRLFDAIGDLAHDVLGDHARAERCWLQIVDIAEVPILDKLLAVQRELGSPRGPTSERLAQLAADPQRKRELALEAVTEFTRAGDLERARPIAEKLVIAHPRDLEVVRAAAPIAEARRAVMWIERIAEPTADLLRVLGDAKRKLGAPEAALTAYRKAVIADPTSEAALGARRALVEMASAAGESAVTSRMALVEAEQDPVDVLASARELVAAHSYDDARLLFDLAQAIGGVLDERDHEFLAKHPLRPMADDEGYATVLENVGELVDDPDEGPLGELFAMLGEAVALLCPTPQNALIDADLLDASRITSMLYAQIAKALGGPATLLYAGKTTELLYAQPPVVILAGNPDRFELGRLVERSRPRRIFAAQSPESFDLFVRGIRYAFGPPGMKVERGVISTGDRIHGATPVALRRRISDWISAFTGDLYDPAYQTQYLAACERAADRAGLVASGDIATAISRVDDPKHLIQLAASQRYFAARRALRPRAVDETTQPFAR